MFCGLLSTFFFGSKIMTPHLLDGDHKAWSPAWAVPEPPKEFLIIQENTLCQSNINVENCPFIYELAIKMLMFHIRANIPDGIIDREKTKKWNCPNGFLEPGLQHVCMLRGISPAKWTRTKLTVIRSHCQFFLWGKVVSQMCYFAGSWPLDFPSSRFFSEFQIHWIEVHYKLEDPCHAQTCHIINTIQHMNQTRSLRNSMKIMHCLSKNHRHHPPWLAVSQEKTWIFEKKNVPSLWTFGQNKTTMSWHSPACSCGNVGTHVWRKTKTDYI